MAAQEQVRFIVTAEMCDHLGHMNVGRYFEACGDAVFSLQSRLGLTRADMAEGRRLSFAVVHSEGDFRAECLAGDVLAVTSGVTGFGRKTMTSRHVMTRDDGQVVFESTFVGALMNLESRRAVEIPPEIIAAARPHMWEAG